MQETSIVSSVDDLRRIVRAWRAGGLRIAFAPTMGALHEGHLSLVREGFMRADRVIVSIFVNPTQFAPNEDFSKYPRTFEQDLQKLQTVGTSLCYRPAVEEIYPPDFATTVVLDGPAKAGLEDRFRPTHFAGVATVVAKLLNQAQADVALFGEKDYQQLKVIARMASDLDIATQIVGVPTLREADGLALSSRNAYLNRDERIAAPKFFAALAFAAQAIRTRQPIGATMDNARKMVSDAGFAIDYVEARCAQSLAALDEGTQQPIRLLGAARIGKTRLIDNVAV